MKPIRPALGAAALAAVLTLAACFGPPSPAPSPSTTASSAPASTSPPASAGTTASGTPAPSSSSASPPAPTTPPAAPPQPTTAPAPPSSSAPAGEGQLPEQTAPLTLYYIAIEDGGVSGPKVGCGDSAVATYTEPVTFRDQVGPSLTRLFANRSREIGESGLVNVLYQSTLKYLGGSFDGTTITVYLSGSFFLGGVCDIPRAEAQINLTAIAAAGAKRAEVFVNGRPMADVLSLK
jgi:hypothetical protein